MDKSIPAGAAILLKFIYMTETSKAAPACYNVIFGNRQSKLTKPLTQMTVAEVQAGQKNWKTKAWAKKFGSSKASSATGAPQFMEFTLAGLIKDLNLSGSQIFDGNLQDRLAYHLLKRRGYLAYMSGTISRTEFGKRIAQEWASFPVLAPCRGAHRDLKRGQSYYAGDGLNNQLTTAAEVENILDAVKAAGNGVAYQEPAIEPAPVDKAPSEPGSSKVNLVAALFAAIGATCMAVWAWLISIPCNLLGVFCGS